MHRHYGIRYWSCYRIMRGPVVTDVPSSIFLENSSTMAKVWHLVVRIFVAIELYQDTDTAVWQGPLRAVLDNGHRVNVHISVGVQSSDMTTGCTLTKIQPVRAWVCTKQCLVKQDAHITSVTACTSIHRLINPLVHTAPAKNQLSGTAADTLVHARIVWYRPGYTNYQTGKSSVLCHRQCYKHGQCW